MRTLSLKPLRVHYKEIIIGSSLEAFIYAFKKGIPIFFANPTPPHRFDYFDEVVDLSPVNIENSSTQLNTPNGIIEKGQQKLMLWERLNFLLNLSGLSPLNGHASNLRFEQENTLKAYNDFSKIATINFEKAWLFEDRQEDKFAVLDWIAVHSGGKHTVDLITTKDDFVREIWFYESNRVYSKIRDICVISYLNNEQMLQFDYSDTYARFKTEKIMKSCGFRGASNGIDKITGKTKHYALKMSNMKREKPNTMISLSKDRKHVEPIKAPEDLMAFNLYSNCDKVNNVLRKLCT